MAFPPVVNRLGGQARKTAVAKTTIVVWAEDTAGNAVSGAYARLIVGGIGIKGCTPNNKNNESRWNYNPKTDGTGRAIFEFPTAAVRPDKSGLLTFWLTVTKGYLSASESGLVRGNRQTEFLLVLEPKAKTSEGTPELRWKNRSQHKMADRSEQELLGDMAWATKKLHDFLDHTELALRSMNHPWKTDRLVRAKAVLRTLSVNAERADALLDVAELVALMQNTEYMTRIAPSGGAMPGLPAPKVAGVLGKFSVALNIVGASYDILDAIDRDDPKALHLAFAGLVFDLLSAAHPLVAVGWTAIKLVWGLKEALTPTHPHVVAVERQVYLEEFNHVGSCPAFAAGSQYRIDISKAPYKCKGYAFKAPIVVGFALDENGGALVFVTSKGEKLPLRIRNQEEADQFRYVLKDLADKL